MLRKTVNSMRSVFRLVICFVALTAGTSNAQESAGWHLGDQPENNSLEQGDPAYFSEASGAVSDSQNDQVVPAAMLQPTPLVLPRSSFESSSNTRTNAIAPTALSLMGESNIVSPPRSNLEFNRNQSYFGSRDVVTGTEGATLATRDLGELLKKTNTAPSVSTQTRTPVVHDPRVRGSRINSLAASGSYWVPARADLDTVLSKFDSRQVESTTIVPGPYTALHGPGFQFVDIQLNRTPRYREGTQWHGATDFDYRSNGAQFFGQQSLNAGGSDWGAQVNYGYRTGDDYQSGNGQVIPSSYGSQEVTAAFGRDWANQSLEFSLLRLDQNNLVFPGYVFDIDDLVTDGYELTHTVTDFDLFDSIETQAWYNRTAFNGSAQNPAKRPYFPTLEYNQYIGTTDVDSTSLGYRQYFVLGSEDQGFKVTAGHDLRFIEQELNEISTSLTLGIQRDLVTNRNSPIPESYSLNPGLFIEVTGYGDGTSTLRTGTRFDSVSTDITDSQAKLAEVGLDSTPASYAEVVGTSDYNQNFQLFSGFVAYETQVNSFTNTLNFGFAQRAPNLTELYAAQPFMLVLQNGVNNVTGDPSLKKESLLQIDWGIETRRKHLHTGFRAYQAWGFDYITFENTSVNRYPPFGDIGQVSLRYVNTDFVTINGFESFATLLPEAALSPYSVVRYTQATDRSRNGSFATVDGARNSMSEKVEGLTRGARSGIGGNNSEPLPGIAPLETRVGLRLRDTAAQRWTIDLSGRIVDNQSRVAASLLESPTAGFATWDIRALVRPKFNPDLLVTCGVENFTDRNYREHLDYRAPNALSVFQPGATFYLGTALTY